MPNLTPNPVDLKLLREWLKTTYITPAGPNKEEWVYAEILNEFIHDIGTQASDDELIDMWQVVVSGQVEQRFKDAQGS